MVLLLVSNFLETSLGIVTFIYLVSPQVVLLLSQAVGLICAGGWLAVVVRYARKNSPTGNGSGEHRRGSHASQG